MSELGKHLEMLDLDPELRITSEWYGLQTKCRRNLAHFERYHNQFTDTSATG